MKLKDCFIPLVDGFQIIQPKEYEVLNENSVLLKKVRLIAGGPFGLRKHFRRYTLLIEEDPQRVEEKLKPFSVVPIFGRKLIPTNKQKYGNDLALIGTKTSLSPLYPDMKLLLKQYNELKRIAARDVQTAKFLEQPVFKQVQHMLNVFDRGMDIFGSRVRSFASAYALRRSEEGSEEIA